MREIARGLRPQALDEFGLRSALVSLASQVTDRTGAAGPARRCPSELPRLAPEQDLALYRVAQESLTNVARHAGARHVELRLARATAAAIELVVRDDGRGIAPAEAAAGGSGLAGMRERALLIGGAARRGGPPGGGTEVRLAIPADGGA